MSDSVVDWKEVFTHFTFFVWESITVKSLRCWYLIPFPVVLFPICYKSSSLALSKELKSWPYVSVTVIFYARTSRCRFESNENEKPEIEITVYMNRLLKNIMWICYALVHKHIMQAVLEKNKMSLIRFKWFRENLAVVQHLKIAAVYCRAHLTDSPAIGRDDAGKRRAFVNLSVKANLKMAPGIFYDCNSFN